MRYRIPMYYSGFACTGAECEDTCCRGWRIGIDEGSYDYYRQVPGAFGRRLRQNIQTGTAIGNSVERTFALNGRDCAFLNREGLCDIYTELGKDKLCHTCRTYPRHMEDYGELREMMLSLSCPEAARLILEDDFQGACRLVEKEMGERSESERSQDPDSELLACIFEARQTMICLMKDRSVGIYERMAMILSYAHDLQYHMNRIRESDYSHPALRRSHWFKRLSKRYLSQRAAAQFADRLEPFHSRGKERQNRISAWMRELQELEPVLSQWEKKQGSICTSLYHRNSGEEYRKLEREFEAKSMALEQEWENLFLYFIYTYLLGACYDEDLYSKVKFAVFSVMVIREWCLFRYRKTGSIGIEDLAAAAYRYSREVENSDKNLETLERLFRENPLFRLKSMLVVLAGAEKQEKKHNVEKRERT